MLNILLKELEAQFPLKLFTETREFINFIEAWDVDRYFIYPYGSEGLELVFLDRAVWDIRRYCIPYNRISKKGTPFEAFDLRHIETAIKHPPQQYRSLAAGHLDRVLESQDDPARPPLIWKNLYFGASRRKSLSSLRQSFSSHNSPLALYPEVIDEVRKFAYLPANVNVLKKP